MTPLGEANCSESTLKRWLDKGKSALRPALTRRGLALPAVLLASGVATSAVRRDWRPRPHRQLTGKAASISAAVAALVHWLAAIPMSNT